MVSVPQVYIPLRKALTSDELSGETDVMTILMLRGLAMGIDWLVLFCVVMAPLGELHLSPRASLVGATLFAILLYLPLSEAAWGRTLGKRLMGLHVINRMGHPPAFWRCLLRSLLWPFEVNALLLWAPAVLSVMFTPNRQRLGDLFSRAYVVSNADLRRIQANHAVSFET